MKVQPCSTMISDKGTILTGITNCEGLIEASIGDKINQLRRKHKISQTSLAKKLSISYQQIQKYESGKNRVSASRLYMIANILDVDISYFYQGLENFNKPNTNNYAQLELDADGIIDKKLFDAIKGIIDVAKKKPKKL